MRHIGRAPSILDLSTTRMYVITVLLCCYSLMAPMNRIVCPGVVHDVVVMTQSALLPELWLYLSSHYVAHRLYCMRLQF
jgi:hypothetical protein